jgi:hypothetical protein
MASQAELALQALVLTVDSADCVLLTLKPGSGAGRVAAQYRLFALELPLPKFPIVMSRSQAASRSTTMIKLAQRVR